VLSGIAELLLAIFLAFFFYRDGPAMASQAELLMEKLAGPRTRHLMQLTGDVTRGVVYGLLGTAVVQGAMTTFGLWIAASRSRCCWGWSPGSSRSCRSAPRWSGSRRRSGCSSRATGWGIFMGVYGGLGISSVDNFIRPW
jgi:predicted PurR-regulated permease PerM